MKKEQWVIDADRRHKNTIKATRKKEYEEKRKKAIKRIRQSWASPYRNDKTIPEHIIKSYL